MVWWNVLLSTGLPAVIFGLFLWLFQRKCLKHDAIKKDQEDARTELNVLLVEGIGAAIALGEATAIAIRDQKCNGEMTKAMEYAQAVKHKQKDFLTSQTVSNLIKG